MGADWLLANFDLCDPNSIAHREMGHIANVVTASGPKLISWDRATFQRQGVAPSSDVGKNVSSNSWPKLPK
jgi:hypothetical protein